MKRIVLVVSLLLAPVLADSLRAQTKTITGETKSITATVEAIEASTRTVTLKGPGGNYVDIVVPEGVERFSTIKIGDTVTARYYENLVLRVQRPGEKPIDSSALGVAEGSGARPGRTASMQRTITATITEIDPKVPSITFTGPNNWKYSSRVEDRNALAKVKVGDKVDITWTAALLVAFDEAKK